MIDTVLYLTNQEQSATNDIEYIAILFSAIALLVSLLVYAEQRKQRSQNVRPLIYPTHEFFTVFEIRRISIDFVYLKDPLPKLLEEVFQYSPYYVSFECVNIGKHTAKDIVVKLDIPMDEMIKIYNNIEKSVKPTISERDGSYWIDFNTTLSYQIEKMLSYKLDALALIPNESDGKALYVGIPKCYIVVLSLIAKEELGRIEDCAVPDIDCNIIYRDIENKLYDNNKFKLRFVFLDRTGFDFTKRDEMIPVGTFRVGLKVIKVN
jgi:hypothetical protein